MIKRLYQVWDRTAEIGVGPIIIEHRDQSAVRIFYDAFADDRSQLKQHPEDYELRLIGYYDENATKIDPMDEPQVVATGQTWLETQNRETK